jgi:hypothetical protein
MDNYLDFDFDLIMNDLEETYIDYDYELNEYNKYINARQIIVYNPIDVNLIILMAFIKYYMLLIKFCYLYNIELLNNIFFKLLKV